MASSFSTTNFQTVEQHGINQFQIVLLSTRVDGLQIIVWAAKLSGESVNISADLQRPIAAWE